MLLQSAVLHSSVFSALSQMSAVLGAAHLLKAMPHYTQLSLSQARVSTPSDMPSSASRIPPNVHLMMQVTLYLGTLVCLRVVTLATCLDKLRAQNWPCTKYDDLVDSVEMRVMAKLRNHLRDIAAGSARPLRPSCPALDLSVCFMDVTSFAAEVGLIDKVRPDHQHLITLLMPGTVLHALHSVEFLGNACQQHSVSRCSKLYCWLAANFSCWATPCQAGCASESRGSYADSDVFS